VHHNAMNGSDFGFRISNFGFPARFPPPVST
jgi:hypothetical protein